MDRVRGGEKIYVAIGSDCMLHSEGEEFRKMT